MDVSLISEMMEKIMDDEYFNMNSVLIIREGRLIFEEYFNNYKWNTLKKIASCTKSYASALIGIAFDQGLITGLDEKLSAFFPEYTDFLWVGGKEKITLLHMLTMTAGMHWVENHTQPDNSHDGLYTTADPFRYVLELPMVAEPGSIFHYNSGLPVLMAGIIKNRSGLYADEFAQEYLFEPLGINSENVVWWKFPNNHPHTGGGLELRPRDMAKFGQLYIQEGIWNGTRIISKNWVLESIKSRDGASYGFQWWLGRHHVNNSIIDSFSARGYGGEHIIVIKELNMVVVITQDNENHDHAFEIMNQYIVPACF